MAEFCKQCNEELGFPEPNDAVGLLTKDQAEAGYLMPFLCEGCGDSEVDHEGKCLAINCLKNHG